MSEPTPLPEYRSGAEFAELMARLEAQLHRKNRIWMGEDEYAWQVARLLGAIGDDFAAAFEDRLGVLGFGNGYDKGTLTEVEQVDELLARLRARLVR